MSVNRLIFIHPSRTNTLRGIKDVGGGYSRSFRLSAPELDPNSREMDERMSSENADDARFTILYFIQTSRNLRYR